MTKAKTPPPPHTRLNGGQPHSARAYVKMCACMCVCVCVCVCVCLSVCARANMTRHVSNVMVSMCLCFMEPPPFRHWCLLLAKCVCMFLFYPCSSKDPLTCAPQHMTQELVPFPSSPQHRTEGQVPLPCAPLHKAEGQAPLPCAPPWYTLEYPISSSLEPPRAARTKKNSGCRDPWV